MTSAGWYPDPAGAPDTYRYWDGQAWSESTSTDPFGVGRPAVAPPVPEPIPEPAPEPEPQPAPEPTRPLAPIQPVQPAPPPPPPPPYGAIPDGPRPQWSPMPGALTPPPQGGPTARVIAIATAAVAFVVLLVIIAFVAVRTLGSGDTSVVSQPVAPANPSPTVPAQPGLPGPSGSLPAAMQCYGGLTASLRGQRGTTLTGGGLTAPALKDRGYRADPNAPLEFSFASSAQAVTKAVDPTWASTVAVGALSKAGGFGSTEAAARTVMSCMANNPLLYTGVTGVSRLSAAPITVDGHRAFSLVENINVADPSTTVKGDTAQVVVVDTGNKQSYGVFLMVVPIGDKAYLALQKSTVEQLRVR